MDKTDTPRHVLDTGPCIAPGVFIARGAQIIGDVRLETGSSVWYNAVLRADINYVYVGANSNIQDGSIVHVENDRPCIIGENITVGHGAILHACTIEAECLIGMGAIILSGAVIGKGSIIAAGAVIRERAVVQPYSLMAGVPAHLVRKLEPGSTETTRKWALKYAGIAQIHQAKGFAADS